jgi:outer membrane protein assembly factor BamE (lipoprotein component of BamABCDE complex)
MLKNSKGYRWTLSFGFCASLIFGAQAALSAKATKERSVETLTYAHFQRLDRGMDEAQVIAILGRPVGIAKPDYSGRRVYDKEVKTDATGYCFVYRGVVGPQDILHNQDEWLVAFSNSKVIFWDKESSCEKFFD